MKPYQMAKLGVRDVEIISYPFDGKILIRRIPGDPSSLEEVPSDNLRTGNIRIIDIIKESMLKHLENRRIYETELFYEEHRILRLLVADGKVEESKGLDKDKVYCRCYRLVA